MDATDLTALTAAEIVARVRDGRTSAVAVATAHLARIAERDGHIGAFQEHHPERVLAEAGAVDRRADRFALPLAGVPVAIKDCVDVAGYPTRYGSAASSAELAKRDDELVKRLRAAGAVVVGKTRMPELAIWGFTSLRARHDAQPARHRAGSRRLQRGQRGRRGRGDGGARARHRRRRLDPHPRGLLRAGRGQARQRCGAAARRGGRALARDVGVRADRAHRGGRRADVVRARRAPLRRRRTGPGARGPVAAGPAAVHASAPRSPRRGGRGGGPAAHGPGGRRGHAGRPALPGRARPLLDAAVARRGRRGRRTVGAGPARGRAPHGRRRPPGPSGAALHPAAGRRAHGLARSRARVVRRGRLRPAGRARHRPPAARRGRTGGPRLPARRSPAQPVACRTPRPGTSPGCPPSSRPSSSAGDRSGCSSSAARAPRRPSSRRPPGWSNASCRWRAPRRAASTSSWIRPITELATPPGPIADDAWSGTCGAGALP